MLIYDDKLFAEIEMYDYSDGGKRELSVTVLLDYTVGSVTFECDTYYRVSNVNYVLDRAFEWKMNRGDFQNDKIDFLDKRYWWFYRSYKTINKLREALGCK